MDSILTLPAPAPDRRVPYGPLPDQFGDLRVPGGEGPFPVVVIIHGGFWRARYDLSHAGHMSNDLRAHGVATWTVEYRRVGTGGGFPQTVEDVVAAFDALRTLDDAHLDLTRVTAVGHSAGGYLALMLGAERAEAAPGLRAVVALAAVSDVQQAARLHLGAGIVPEFMGGTPETTPERYTAGSPYERLPLGVEQELIHGEDDEIIPPEMSERYGQRAHARGDRARVIILPRTGHFEVIDPRTPQFGVVRERVLALVRGETGSQASR